MSPTDLVVRPLFAEFPPPTEGDWREAARAELGGKTVEEKLGDRKLDGIPIQPIYTRSAEAGLPHLGSRPGSAPFVRGGRGEPGPWAVRVDVDEARPAQAAARVAAELDGGATEIAVLADRAARGELDPHDARSRGAVGEDGVSIATCADLDAIVAVLDPSAHALVIATGAAPLGLAARAIASLGTRSASLDSLTVAADPLGALAASGTSHAPLDAAYGELAALARWAARHGSALRVAVASGAPYHDAGASVDQELGLAVAAAVEYLRALVDRGVPAPEAARRIAFSFPVGTRLFLEAAKLRAARLVWGQVLAAFDCEAAAARVRIHATTSRRSETEFDPWVNMIRGTVEAFAAVVGGADSVSVAPFDHALRPSDGHSQRVARNTHALLRDESHLAKVQDPGGGSYFVESLTDAIARKAWGVLQQIEKEGGLAAALASGRAQALVVARSGERRAAASKRLEPLIGVSKFPNLGEQRPARSPCDRKALREERIADLSRQRAALDADRLVAALAALAAERDPVARVEKAIAAAASGATLG
ncbi:MAG: methylmalonyl-CoA mutase family protein [bacterium]